MFRLEGPTVYNGNHVKEEHRANNPAFWLRQPIFFSS